MKRIGVDTGGTFTGSVLWDEEEGLLASAKVSLNRVDPSRAVVALDKLGEPDKADVRYFIHGTTVATNATLERTGPRIGMICTAGFRDVLEIACLTRPPEHIYDLPQARPRCRRSRASRGPSRKSAVGTPITSLIKGASCTVCALSSSLPASILERSSTWLMDQEVECQRGSRGVGSLKEKSVAEVWHGVIAAQTRTKLAESLTPICSKCVQLYLHSS
jgi:hypothetical protein